MMKNKPKRKGEGEKLHRNKSEAGTNYEVN
jgi:hypothetical protein